MTTANTPGFAEVMKALDGIEAKMAQQATIAEGQQKTLGQVSADTKAAIDSLGLQQRELADRLLTLEQRGATPPRDEPAGESWGQQFIKAIGDRVGDLVTKRTNRVAAEVKNTITNTVGNTFSDRRPGIVPGAFREFTLEALLTTLPTTSNAVDYVR